MRKISFLSKRYVRLGLLAAFAWFALALLLPSQRAAADPTIVAISGTDASGNPVDKDGNAITRDSKLDPTMIPEIRLNERLVVFLTGDTALDPNKVVLALDNRPIKGLSDTIYLANLHALVFHLVRTTGNAPDWGPLLDKPGSDARRIEVGFWQDATALDKTSQPTVKPIAMADGTQPQIDLVLISAGWLLAAAVIAVVIVLVVIKAAKDTNLLRDNLLPQLKHVDQPYSLGRAQMAFWFTLVFGSFIFLFVLLRDYNTVTQQALILMGISGATGVFAVAIDAAKESPIGNANEKLRALGLNTCEDVVQLDVDIEQANAKLPAAATYDAQMQLKQEIADLYAKKRTYTETVTPFKTSGWYKDMTTDVNGPALHRVQVFYWTLALGAVFLFDVYGSLAMPTFSETLLALMGITSAGYIGFKYPEKQA